MNTAASVLSGTAIYVPGHDPVSRLVRQHLVRLGATQTVDAAEADIAVGDHGDARLDEVAGIVCELAPFELDDGGLVFSETTAQAALDLASFIGPVGGRPDRTGTDVASSAAAFLAVTTICASRFGLPHAGAGTRFSTSPLRALALLKSLCFAGRSRPDAWVGSHVRSRDKEEDAGYATADGHVTLDFPADDIRSWRKLCDALNIPPEFVDANAADFVETVGWGDRVDAARPVYELGLSRLTTADAVRLIVANGGSSVPFQTLDECLQHPQAAAVDLDQSFANGLPFDLEVRRGPPLGPRTPQGSIGSPLAGVRILDLGIGGVGPFAPMILGRLGADVIKIEPPSDFAHAIGPWTDGVSTTYLACNTAKRSVRLDLKDASDRDDFFDLVRGADVVNANFRPGVLDRLGVSFDQLVAVNPHIVLATTSGYGWAGPMRDQPCTDPHAQAFAGFAALNARPATGRPRRCRYIGFVDVVTSAVVAEGICVALLARDAAGGAAHSQTSMMHAVCETAQTLRDDAPPLAPDDIFRAADGWFALTCRDDGDWHAVVEALDDPSAVTTEEFATSALRHRNRDALRDALEGQFIRKAALGWVRQFAGSGTPAVRLIDDDEAIARVDYRRAGLVRELAVTSMAPILVGGDHAVFRGADSAPGHRPPVTLSAPLPGEHDDIHRALGARMWLTSGTRPTDHRERST